MAGAAATKDELIAFRCPGALMRDIQEMLSAMPEASMSALAREAMRRYIAQWISGNKILGIETFEVSDAGVRRHVGEMLQERDREKQKWSERLFLAYKRARVGWPPPEGYEEWNAGKEDTEQAYTEQMMEHVDGQVSIQVTQPVADIGGD